MKIIFTAGKNRIEDITSRKSKVNILRNIDLLGHFDFQNLILTLDYYSSQEIEEILRNNDFHQKSELLSLVTHEYTHFIDCTSTLWGLNHINLMQNAYSVNYATHGQEKNFYHAKLFFDYLKRIKLPDYYNQVGEIDVEENEWRKQHSIGLIFAINGHLSDSPVIFTNFHDAENNLIARSPFSDLSLLECSATYQETKIKLHFLEGQDSDFYTVEKTRIKRELEKSFYNKNLTEYSVCTHLVLEKLAKKDIFFALEVASNIARFCLNASSATFEDIRRSRSFNHLLGYDLASLKRFNKALGNNNRGVLFFLITQIMNVILENNQKTFEEIFGHTLKKLGISDSHQEHSLTEANNYLTKINSGKIELLKAVANSGYVNLRKTIGKFSSLDYQTMHLPPCYLNDAQQFNPFFSEKNNLCHLDCDYFFDQLNQYESSMYRFVEGCTN